MFSCTGGRVIPKVIDTTPTIDTQWPIKRVIYVMLENRSFNNLFGKFPGAIRTKVGNLAGDELKRTGCKGDFGNDLLM